MSDEGRRPAPHRFGGTWTQRKLEIVQRYLSAYMTALKGQPFHLVYVDAFAGTGSRVDGTSEALADPTPTGLPPDEEGDPTSLHKGSVRLALEVRPPFDEYVFIEKSPARCQELKQLCEAISPRPECRIVQDDANSTLQRLCVDGLSHRSWRAVVFLDPYGLQVDWATVEAIGRTQKMDMWLLFPLSGCNRMLERTGSLPEAWKNRLTRFFGTSDWENELYESIPQTDLFDESRHTRQKAPIEQVGRFVVERLKRVFAVVLESPAVLRDDRGRLLFLLLFACGNKPGGKVALPIVQHLVKDSL